MPLTEAELSDDYQVWLEFMDRYKLGQFQHPGNHNQITKAQSFKEFAPPDAAFVEPYRSQRQRAGTQTEDLYTIVLDKPEHEQQLRTGLSTPGLKKQWVKLYVGKIGIGGDVENIQWGIGRVYF
jgi:hypothetical protein